MFGPPDYIIDGTQRIEDLVALQADWSGIYAKGAPIPTRVLTAPDGTVILIYENPMSKGWSAFAAGHTGVAQNMHTKPRPNEFFIYLSKKDRTVVATSGNPRK